MALADWSFGVFIITHGRPNDVVTDKTLRRAGYSGRIWYVVDDEDTSRKQYHERFAESVLTFCKRSYADRVDEGDNSNNRRTTTHARNACFDLAKAIGLEWFLVLDDDYTAFELRTDCEQQYPTSRFRILTKLDAVFEAVLSFAQHTSFATVALAQGGDMLGGICGNSSFVHKPTIYRKAMNSFFMNVNRRIWFVSRLNEDVNTYCTLGSRGVLFGTIPLASIVQRSTQQHTGGMTEAYQASGTYVKSFSTVMYCPSFARVQMLNSAHPRIHHRIDWKTAVPVIVPESCRRT